MTDKIPNVEGGISDYLTGIYSKSMYMADTDAYEILNIITMLKSCTSTKIIKDSQTSHNCL